jgi:hypothetical protein
MQCLFAYCGKPHNDGKATHRSWSGKYDGNDCMITGDPSADTISLTKPYPNTIKYVFKKNGKEVDNGNAVISKDAKTITDVGGGKDEKGQAFTYAIVMEKQSFGFYGLSDGRSAAPRGGLFCFYLPLKPSEQV